MNTCDDLMSDALTTRKLPDYAQLQNATASCGSHGGTARNRYSRRFGYAIPCQEAVDAIIGLDPFLEVGAGNGFWSYWLRVYGCNVVASDPGLEAYSR